MCDQHPACWALLALKDQAACLHNDIGLHITVSMAQQVLGCVVILYIPVGPCALL